MPALEVADIFRRHGESYRRAHADHLSRTERRVMGAIEACRTAALGGHVERCAECGLVRISYNSCRDRHCPKCQGSARAAWLAERQAELFQEAGIVTGAAALLQGIARITSGDLDGGDAALADAARLGQQAGTDGIAAEAMAVRSLAAMARGNWVRAEDLAGQARATLRLAAEEDSYIAPLVCAAEARAAIHRGDVEAARRQLVSAQRARPLLTYAIPHVAVQARIELTRAHLALGDTAGARTLLREIDDLLKRCPHLGTLVAEAEALRARIGAERDPRAPGASSLTAAELRILPLLATHLSYPEIAAELFVSPNTVKSQAYSIFRKLGASSRNEAVIRSRQLELLDG